MNGGGDVETSGTPAVHHLCEIYISQGQGTNSSDTPKGQ